MEDSNSQVIEPDSIEQTLVLKDIEGNVVNIPSSLPWGKEKKVLKIVGQAFKRVMPKKDKNAAFDSTDFLSFANKFDLEPDVLDQVNQVIDAYSAQYDPSTTIDTNELLQFFSMEAPELITELVCVITGKSAQVIDDTYDGQSVLKFAIPYVISAMRKYAESFTAMNQ